MQKEGRKVFAAAWLQTLEFVPKVWELQPQLPLQGTTKEAVAEIMQMHMQMVLAAPSETQFAL